MTLPRYTEYKDSGNPQIGFIPDHWSTPPLYLRYSIELGKMLDAARIKGEYLTPYLRNVDVQWGNINFEDLPSMDIEPSESERYLVRNGDLLVCEGGEVGRAAIVRGLTEPMGFQKALHRMRALSRNEHPEYMYYTLRWAAASGSFSGEGQSTIAHLTGEQLRKYRLPAPPVREQQLISSFLDRETHKIDTLIAEQERLIALLSEKRQASISRVVTGGLDAESPLKDSGVLWLGQVPSEREVVRLGALLREVNEAGDETLPVLSVSIHDGVSDRELEENEMERKITRSEDRTKYKAVLPGDLTYNMMRAWQGGLGAVSTKGMVSPAYVVARPHGDDVLSSYLEMVLRTQAGVAEMKRYSRGVTDFRLRLYWEEFKNIRIALPPKSEQLKIVSVIAQQTEEVGRLTGEAERAIGLLKERRSALITAAVTGQIDVRGLVDADVGALASMQTVEAALPAA